MRKGKKKKATIRGMVPGDEPKKKEGRRKGGTECPKKHLPSIFAKQSVARDSRVEWKKKNPQRGHSLGK